MLIISTLLASWLGMQAVHELGHVLGAWVTGGRVARVVLNPLTLSRTDLAENPHPLAVVWAGPVFGVVAPLVCWGIAAWCGLPGWYVVRFFAGFCLIANGAYIGAGSFDGVGDCGGMLRHGSPMWTLWMFGLVTVPVGVGLWHRLGPWFGLGSGEGRVSAAVSYAMLGIAIGLLVFGFAVDGD